VSFEAASPIFAASCAEPRDQGTPARGTRTIVGDSRFDGSSCRFLVRDGDIPRQFRSAGLTYHGGLARSARRPATASKVAPTSDGSAHGFFSCARRRLTSELSGEPAARPMVSPGRRAGEVRSNDKLAAA